MLTSTTLLTSDLADYSNVHFCGFFYGHYVCMTETRLELQLSIGTTFQYVKPFVSFPREVIYQNNQFLVNIHNYIHDIIDFLMFVYAFKLTNLRANVFFDKYFYSFL